jgi:hypothetical protein
MAEYDQQFDSFTEWKNKASSWLTRRQRWDDDNKFRAICFDAKGRYCYNGGCFMRARDEGAFPIRWLWPDQIASIAVLHPLSEIEKLPQRDDA